MRGDSENKSMLTSNEKMRLERYMKGQIAIFRIRCLLFIVLLAFSLVTIIMIMIEMIEIAT